MLDRKYTYSQQKLSRCVLAVGVCTTAKWVGGDALRHFKTIKKPLEIALA